jgi:hypothetical protein
MSIPDFKTLIKFVNAMQLSFAQTLDNLSNLGAEPIDIEPYMYGLSVLPLGRIHHGQTLADRTNPGPSFQL